MLSDGLAESLLETIDSARCLKRIELDIAIAARKHIYPIQRRAPAPIRDGRIVAELSLIHI